MASSVVALLVMACSGPAASVSAKPDPATNKLAQVLDRGTLRLPTDPAYPPASYAVTGATRASGTRCAPDQMTAPELDGYDVAAGKLIARDLGVEPCFLAPTWSELLAGNWGDRWDVAFASIGLTKGRMGTLLFTRPYYGTPERFYVLASGPAQRLEQLDGKRIGVCTGCFADLYLQKRLDLPGEAVTYRVDSAEIVGYAVERQGLQDVADGKLAAFLCQETAGQRAIDEGLALRALEPAAYTAFPAGALDRTSGLQVKTFLDELNRILGARLKDGSLSGLSTTYFGHDYAAPAAAFDLASIVQTVP
jgi:polar amino acid transport system substrate-binding protein